MIYFLFLLIPLTYAEVKTEFSGNIELQARHVWNNPEAKRIPFLNQNWKEENFTQGFASLAFEAQKDNSKIEANWFGRQAYSPLYQNNSIATQIYTFPNKLVTRDLFKLQYQRVDGDHQTDSTMTKFFYEYSHDEGRIIAGRMFINYGLGEIFNPLNPFNQPTALTSMGNISQGNDGLRLTYFQSSDHTLDFFLLGDKSIDNYEGRIDRTLWLHGEYQASDKLTLDYVLGEDQNRQKIGGQTSYQFDQALGFFQVLYQTEYTNKKPSDNLWDLILGFDQQITTLYHLRIETGYQKQDLLGSTLSFNNRFLPTEYFVSVSHIYEVHPLVKLNGTFINDIKTGFTYFIGKTTWSMSNNTESELFVYSPVGKGSEANQMAQRLITTDIGFALRTFF